MRRVDDLADFAAQLELAKKEAMRAFGDERVLIEKLIERPRHLEVQLAGDRHGNLVHLFERECSIQRNYQKVIEEAPAPRLAPAVRAQLLDAALKLGREIGYDSLGTVEFVLAEGADTPYFLEMNTRLQVEHPVTEMVTGLDLVEWQIRIAAGEPLPLEQADIGVSGWAVEARVNCEDPAHGHRPEFGTVGRYVEPALAGLRVDSGIATGSVDPAALRLDGRQADRPRPDARPGGRPPARWPRRLRGRRHRHQPGPAARDRRAQPVPRRPADDRLSRRGLSRRLARRMPRRPARRRIAAGLAALRDREGRAVEEADPWQQGGGFRFMAAAGRRAAMRLRVALDGEELALSIERDAQRLARSHRRWRDAAASCAVARRPTSCCSRRTMACPAGTSSRAMATRLSSTTSARAGAFRC